MSDDEPMPNSEPSGDLTPPRPPKPPVVGLAGDEGNDDERRRRRKETVRISLPAKGKEIVRIAVMRDADFEQ